jgi:hypothetical protein
MKLPFINLDSRNPFFPLPLDYDELSVEGQRLARLAVLQDHSTPEKFLIAWWFLRTFYLAQSKEAVLYKDGVSESPPFHYEMILDAATFGRNAWAAPRGTAKSHVIGLELPLLLLLTRSNYEIILALATDKLVEERFERLRPQLERNELIIGDFGNLVPTRGKGTFNNHRMCLTNGSILQGLSVMGKKRGGRPHMIVMDDPENDPDSDSDTSRAMVIAKFETILWKQFIPMLKSGSSMEWVGTLIDRKSFLYRATMGDDPRFDFWNRKVYKAMSYNDDSSVSLLWPAMWPRDVLEARRDEIGPSAFASEYLNSPVSATDRLLNIDVRKNEYSVEGDFDTLNPLSYTGKVSWCERVFDDGGHRTYLEREMPYMDHVRPMFRCLLFDYASGLTSYNDYSCCAIVGFDREMTMWVLYMWMGRAKDAALYRQIYEIGCAWKPRIIGIEAVGMQKGFMEATQDYIEEQRDSRGETWKPRVFPVTYPSKESKAQRISSALEWRFDSGRIKYPAHLQAEWPYDQLYAQTSDFTMDLALLQHDDAIDTLAQSKYLIKSKGSKLRRERGKPGLLERIKRGVPEVKGLPILSGISSAELSDEMLNIMAKKAARKVIIPKRRKLERGKVRLIRP